MVITANNNAVFVQLGGGALGTSHKPDCTDGYNPNHIAVKISCALIYAFYHGLFRKFVKKVYILCVDGEVGHWTCPYGVRDSVKYWLEKWGIPYEVIDTHDKWYNILTSGEKDLLIINTHGEAVPIPPQYAVIYDPSSGWVSNYKDVCKQFYIDLLKTIDSGRWVWIEPIGYTWYNAVQNGKCTCQGPDGALGSGMIDTAFKSVWGYGINCWGHRDYMPNQYLRALYKKVYGEDIGVFHMPRGHYVADMRKSHDLAVDTKTGDYHVGLLAREGVDERLIRILVSPSRQCGFWTVDIYKGATDKSEPPSPDYEYVTTVKVSETVAFFWGSPGSPPSDFNPLWYYISRKRNDAPLWSVRVGGSKTYYAFVFQAQVFFPADGTYKFVCVTDDGFRLYIDDKLVLDAWKFQPPTRYSVDVELSRGWHKVVVKYFEGAGAWVCLLGVVLPDGTEVKPIGSRFGIIVKSV